MSNRGCHDCHEWEGKGKDGNDQTLRVGNGMTGMTRNIRIRRDQVGYKRVWELGLYLELEGFAKQGTGHISISNCNLI